jgi:poly-gamma-glutamate synthesis protein (capsule biosynthesis protein)
MGPPSLVYLSNQASLGSVLTTPSVSLLFVGDIMLSRGVEKSVLENNDGDFSFLFKKTDFIKEADIAFGNLEGPISLAGRNLGSLYSFRFKPDALDALKNAGFDVLSVANNHSVDWGEEAFEENIFRLKNEEILPIGGGVNREDASRVKIIKKDGLKIGFLGFSDVGPDWFEAKKNKAGILTVKKNVFEPLIYDASQKADVLIVSLHFGEEYEKSHNERQEYLARLAIDNGAKIVIGHHPHVIQKIEEYKNGIIAYSLGDFVFDQDFSEKTMEGLVLEVFLDGKEIIATKKNKVKLNQFFQPESVN